MNSQEFVLLVSALANNIAEGKTQEEIAILAALFTQIGDTLNTIIVFDLATSNLEETNDKIDTELKD